jgi:hypothetical protein
MRIITLGLLATSVLALGACHPKQITHSSFSKMSFSDDDGTPLKTVATLDCPQTQGALNRTAQAADGKSCDYQGPGDETVHLSLVALDGKSATDALSPIKTEMQALVPPPATGAVNVEASKDEGGDRAKVDREDLRHHHPRQRQERRGAHKCRPEEYGGSCRSRRR